MLNVSPETAMMDNYAYIDCSGFVSAFYKELIGIDIYPGMTSTTTNTWSMANYARDNKKNTDVLLYVDTSAYPDEEDQTAVLEDLERLLRPGDVLVYRHKIGGNEVGHALLYMGEDSFLHATGRSYDYENREERSEAGGALNFLSSQSVFVDTGNRYLFRETVTRFTVLRPTNRAGWTFTDTSWSRFDLSSVVMEKMSSVDLFSSVAVGESITYTLHIENRGNQPIGPFEVTTTLPVEVEFEVIQNGGIHEDGVLTWSVASLESDSSISLEYTVKVESQQPTGSLLTSGETWVNAIQANFLYHTIIASEEDLNALANIIVSTVDSDDFTSSMDFLQHVFDTYTGEERANPIASYENLEDLFNAEALTHPFLYGGSYYDDSQDYNEDSRARLLRSTYLEVGDIIIYLESEEQYIVRAGTKHVPGMLGPDPRRAADTREYSFLSGIGLAFDGWQ